ncbi:hypothetical protein JTB14_013079 [Gonioctena quinquepunctata]|nr:hypothetical protein JTB14_013079 [Gonioctena quinquepunctata]
MKFVVIQLTFFFMSVSSMEVKEDAEVIYYWRDYTGRIPSDAVPGGYDLNHETTYIGQVIVEDVGILPGIIYPGVKEMLIPEHGVKKVDYYIKIFCSPHKHAFKWIPVTDQKFKVQTINEHLVKGGIEKNNLLDIGRIAYQGEVVTGKIVTNSPDYPDTAPMFFVYKNEEHKTTNYEVLVSM